MEANESNESEKSCTELLTYLFSDYQSLLKRIAPNGWNYSEFKKFYHPTPEQQFDEYKTLSENLARLSKKPVSEYDKTLLDFQKEYVGEEAKEPEECIEVLGNAVYDIFSNNHEVISASGKVYDLGSMRGSAGFIADFLNSFFEEYQFTYDYIDFYVGTIFLRDRADMTPFYEYVFKKLKEKECSWKYSFPRLYLLNFNDTKDEETPPEKYNPEESLLREIEKNEKNEKLEKMRQELDRAHLEELEEAKYKPPPKVVQAYKNIFGSLPQGYPQ
jgi:hypothetical protein